MTPRIALGASLAMLLLSGCGGGDQPAPQPKPTPSPSATPTPDAAAQLKAAIAAAPAGEPSLDYGDDRLVRTSFGPVLLRHARVKDFGHADTGTVAAYYLAPKDAGFTLAKAYPEMIQSGSMGDFSEWYVSEKLAKYPVVGVEGGGTWQGCSVSFLTLVELTPQGPVTLADVPLSFDDSGMTESGEGQHFEGKLTDIVPDRGFTMRYSGTQPLAERYVRRGKQFVLEKGGQSQVPGC